MKELKTLIGILLLRAISIISTFIISMLLSNYYLDTEEFALYNYLFSIVSFSVVISYFGLNTSLVRQLPRIIEKKLKSQKIFQISFYTISISLVIVLFLIIINFYFNQNQNIYMLASIVPIVGFKIFGFSLQGFKRQIQSIFFDRLILNSLIIISFFLAFNFFGLKSNFKIVSQIFLICSSITFMFTLIKFNETKFDYSLINFNSFKKEISNAFQLFINSGLGSFISNLPILILGIISFNDIAFIVPALKIITIGSLILSSINIYLRPYISEHYKNKKIKKLNEIYSKVIACNLVIGILFVTTILISGKYLLSLWGLEYANKGELFLYIVIFQSFINLIFGPGGAFLNMMGFEKKERSSNIYFITSYITTQFIFYLLKMEILTSTAISMVISSLVQNLIRYYYVSKILIIKKNDIICSYRKMWRDINT
ncbi:hypothetical protein N9543_03450 [Flavobacteriaceae bacterium]|nr:hypothetical protein [Flavobacteriaceae bacterium]